MFRCWKELGMLQREGPVRWDSGEEKQSEGRVSWCRRRPDPPACCKEYFRISFIHEVSILPCVCAEVCAYPRWQHPLPLGILLLRGADLHVACGAKVHLWAPSQGSQARGMLRSPWSHSGRSRRWGWV